MGELEQLLDENKEWLERDGNVVHCRLTGHAMPLRADAIMQYMRGKQFVKLRTRAEELQALKQYEPHIVPSAFVSDRLFCRITGRLVHMNEAAVLRHSEGKRFQTQLEFVRAGSGLKKEVAPEAAAATAAPESKQKDDASAPAIWVPPAHVLASASEESEDEPVPGADAGGDDSADAGTGDEFDWDADGGDDDEAVPVVVQPKARAADKRARRKRQNAGAGGAQGEVGAKRARKEAK